MVLPWLPRITTFASSSEVYIWLVSFLVCDRLVLVVVVVEALGRVGFGLLPSRLFFKMLELVGLVFFLVWC